MSFGAFDEKVVLLVAVEWHLLAPDSSEDNLSKRLMRTSRYWSGRARA